MTAATDKELVDNVISELIEYFVDPDYLDASCHKLEVLAYFSNSKNNGVEFLVEQSWHYLNAGDGDETAVQHYLYIRRKNKNGSYSRSNSKFKMFRKTYDLDQWIDEYKNTFTYVKKKWFLDRLYRFKREAIKEINQCVTRINSLEWYLKELEEEAGILRLNNDS